MSNTTQEKGKLLALAVLAVISTWLVYRNVIQPSRQNPAASATRAAAGAGPASRNGDDLSRGSSSRDASARRDQPMNPQQLAALDPTLRLDLLQKVSAVKYQGGARNIFQFYAPPPPKPVAPPIVPVAAPAMPPVPPPPAISLKFYGTSSYPGSPEKKAFLTDGDQIFIGREGDLIANHYKIVRIAVNSLEWEDTLTHQRGQLPLIEE